MINITNRAPLVDFGVPRVHRLHAFATAESMRELTDKDVFALLTVPAILASVVWDYVDSVESLSAYAAHVETKRMSRMTRDLRAHYERFVANRLGARTCARLAAAQEEWQSRHAHALNMIRLAAHQEARNGRPDLDEGDTDLVVTTATACAVFKVLRMYTMWADNEMARKAGIQQHSVMPKSVAALANLLHLFAGNAMPDLNRPAIHAWTMELYRAVRDTDAMLDIYAADR